MNYNSETETLLNILGAYRRQIIKNGKEHPTVVISNIFDSMNHILNVYDYNGKYAEDKGKTYR